MGTPSKSATPTAQLLIEYESDGQWKWNESAAESLQAVGIPIAVYSVLGEDRSEKNTVMNELCGARDIFSSAKARNPGKKGFWIWISSQKLRFANGIQGRVAYVDPMDFEKQEKVDSQIASFIMLMTTNLVYVATGDLTLENLQYLGPIGDAFEKFRIKTDEKDSPESKSEILPSLSFVLSQLCLLQTSPGKIPQLRDYVVSRLSSLYGTQGYEPYEKMLDLLNHNFDKRNHIHSEKKFSPSDEDDLSKLQSWAESLKKHIQPKSMASKVLSGTSLSVVLSLFVGIANKNTPVSLVRVVEKGLTQDYSTKITEAMKIYESNILKVLKDGTIAFDESHIVKVHHDAEVMTLDWYTSQMVNHGLLENENFRLLQTKMSQSFQKLLDANRKCSESNCRDVFLTETAGLLQKKMEQQQYELVSDVQQDWKRVMVAYSQKSRGPAKYEVLDHFVRTQVLDSVSSIHEEILSKEYHLRKITEDLVKKTKHKYQFIIFLVLAVLAHYWTRASAALS